MCLQCFSSVVGPNGSGKSNVIDAMLFVFGKRAKQVRQRYLQSQVHILLVCTKACLRAAAAPEQGVGAHSQLR